MTVFFENIQKITWKCLKKYRSCFCFVICILLSVQLICKTGSSDSANIALADESLSMYSGSYALTDGDTGRVLAGKQETSPMANASTTKILTCIVTLENCALEEVVTISSNAASQPKVRLGMSEGEQYPLKDMLYGLMLESYNDCAVAIAEHVAGSTEAFASMMNEKAEEIGCVDTYFITPNGLDAEDSQSFHHTTAADLCRIMAYCTWESPKKTQFLEITQTRNFSGTANGKNYSFVNHNAFLNQMEGVLSGKTGFTNKAGYCYVAAMERNGERYCIALLACGWPNNKTYKWKDARTLFEHGIENYEKETVTIQPLETHIEIDGYTEKSTFKDINQEQQLKLYAEEKEYQVLLAEGEQLETELVLDTDTPLPIDEGQKMGVCHIYLGDTLLDSFEIKTRNSAMNWNLKKIWKEVVYQFFTFS